MKKTAKRIVAKIYRALAQVDVIIPTAAKEQLEDLVEAELKEAAKRDAMLGREENDEK